MIGGAFLPNPDFEAELMAEEEQRQALAGQTESARELAERYSPRIMPRVGRARQIEVVTTEDGVFLVNHAYGAAIEEFGSRNNAPFAPLRRGVLGAGLRLEETKAP